MVDIICTGLFQRDGGNVINIHFITMHYSSWIGSRKILTFMSKNFVIKSYGLKGHQKGGLREWKMDVNKVDHLRQIT